MTHFSPNVLQLPFLNEPPFHAPLPQSLSITWSLSVIRYDCNDIPNKRSLHDTHRATKSNAWNITHSFLTAVFNFTILHQTQKLSKNNRPITILLLVIAHEDGQLNGRCI